VKQKISNERGIYMPCTPGYVMQGKAIAALWSELKDAALCASLLISHLLVLESSIYTMAMCDERRLSRA
jgi:hypothetical protein